MEDSGFDDIMLLAPVLALLGMGRAPGSGV